MAADDVDALFEIDPGEFVRARDALVKRLRAEGRREEAQEVRGLRRPTIVVWALNQLGRKHGDLVEGLLAAGEKVRSAQQAAGGSRLREADDELHACVSGLAARAAARLDSKGAASTTRQAEVQAALRGVALSGNGADELRSGRLQHVPEASTGEEMWLVGGAVETEPADRSGADTRLTRAQQRRQRATADVDRARERVERTKRRVDDLRAQLEREEASMKEALQELKDVEHALSEARRAVQRLEGRRSR